MAVCESLSEAYQAVAGQLLLAAQQLLVTTSVPLRPPPHTSSILPAALQSAVSSPFSCSTLKLRQLWWLWLQQLEQGSSTLPVGRVGIVVHSDHHRKQQHSKLHRKSYNETMDRGDMDDDGFHTNESDVNDLGQFVDAALCSMDDPVACGVCTSHRHFWGGLLWLIGEAKVLLLLGGADYANSVLVVSAAKHRQWKDEMCSRKNIYEE